MPTRDGVYYDLAESPHTVMVDGFDLVFSSRAHKDRFLDRLDSEVKAVNGSLTRRFGFEVDASVWAAIRLYNKIESRGFLIRDSFEAEFGKDGGEIECPDTLRFAGSAHRRTA